MKQVLYRFWFMSCSIVLFITYLLCFSNTISISNNTNDWNDLTYLARTSIVETSQTLEFKRENVKDNYKEAKGQTFTKSYLLPFLPLVFYTVFIKKKTNNKQEYDSKPVFCNTVFIPSLGANAPPVFILN